MRGLKGRRFTKNPQRKPTAEELYGPGANVVSLDKWRETKELMNYGREELKAP